MDACSDCTTPSPGPSCSPASLEPADSGLWLSHFSDSQLSLSLPQAREKEPSQMRRDIALLGKEGTYNPQSNCVQIKAVTAEWTEDSNSGTGFLFSAALALLLRNRGELLNIIFFVSYEPSVPVLKKNPKTKTILFFSKCVCIGELSHVED